MAFVDLSAGVSCATFGLPTLSYVFVLETEVEGNTLLDAEMIVAIPLGTAAEAGATVVTAPLTVANFLSASVSGATVATASLKFKAGLHATVRPATTITAALNYKKALRAKAPGRAVVQAHMEGTDVVVTDQQLIEGEILKTNGTPFANCPLSFLPLKFYRATNHRVKSRVNVTTNGSGEFSLTLSAGLYKVSINQTDLLVIEVPWDDQPHTFGSLVKT